MKRVFIIHGWGDKPTDNWYLWLKSKLDENGFQCKVPEMPKTDEPEIESWVGKLKEVVKAADEETYLVGHSIGCQTILRYLARLDPGVKIGGVLFVGGWVHLKPIIADEEDSEEIAEPWLGTPIDWEKIKIHCNKFTAFFSDDDYYVPIEDAQIFKDLLGAKIIVEKGKGHFTEKDGVTEVPEVLKELLNLIQP